MENIKLFWKRIMSNALSTIFFIDAGNAFITTEEFAKAVRNSDNYYVLITRQNLYYFSHSGDVIYGIRSLGKYQDTKKTFSQIHRINL